MASTNGWCIVALPEENHPVHKVSSEKSAHMTILFLGDQREPALAIRIIEALQHTVATSLKHKFSLGVQKRGTLGQDQADVLFFYKDETGRVKDFRSLLLKNDDIKKAYDATEQFPEWTPHLTLGYPDAPANPMSEDNHSISWITFDRIALWLEDSDGPEFELGNYGTDLAAPEDVFHTDRMIQKGIAVMETPEDFLAHYGVKGMKWGQRKAGTGAPSSRKAARSEKKERVSAYKQVKSDHKKAAKAAYRKEIDTARSSIKSKEQKVEQTRAAYKSAKKAEGRRSVAAFKAKQEWGMASKDLEKTVATASQLRDGKEVAISLLSDYAKSRS